MDARPARGVVLCLTKHLAGYWRDIPVTTENVANHIQYRIAFGPTEVSMWHVPHAYFSWTEGNPVLYMIRYVLSGYGDVAPITREVLRQAEHNPARRPRIHAL